MVCKKSVHKQLTVKSKHRLAQSRLSSLKGTNKSSQLWFKYVISLANVNGTNVNLQNDQAILLSLHNSKTKNAMTCIHGFDSVFNP